MKSKFIILIYIYEMFGGILGVIMTALMMFFSSNSILSASISPANRTIYTLIYIVFFILFSLSFVAGYLLYKKKRLGLRLSMIVQLFQIPTIAVPGFIYAFIAGLQIGAGLTVFRGGTRFGALMYFGSTFHIYFGTNINYTTVGVNVLAIVVIISLRRFRKGLDYEEEYV